MPKSSQQSNSQEMIHCQQAGDYTVVTAASVHHSNKENIVEHTNQPNYQILSQTIAYERLQWLRIVELEYTIFTQAFQLIETYYRPLDVRSTTESNTVRANTKRKRNIGVANDSTQTKSQMNEGRHYLGGFPMPRKRIHGLLKSYKCEYMDKMNRTGVSKHYGLFHHHHIDWQLVFACVIDLPTNGGNNLAKELNYDPLFDYEDVIATTANLLAIARQQSELFDGLVLHAPEHERGKMITSTIDYVRDHSNKSGSNQFYNLITLIEQLIKQRRDRIGQVQELKEYSDSDSIGTHLLANWFRSDKVNITKVPVPKDNVTNEYIRELNAWEELVDVVEISPK